MSILSVLIVLALIATISVLFVGIFSMGHGGEFDQKHSSQLMFARVGTQGITILLLLVALFVASS